MNASKTSEISIRFAALLAVTALLLILSACAGSRSAQPPADGNRQTLPNTGSRSVADIQALISSSEAAYQKNDFVNAGKLYQELIKVDPRNAHAYLRLGNIETITGKLDSAREYYEQALDLEPMNHKLHYNLATVHLAKVEDHLSFYTAISEDEEVEKNVLDLLYAIERFSSADGNNE